MKKYLMAAAVAIAALMPATASAWDLKNVLGNSDLGNTVSNAVEGLFTTDNLEVSDLVGEWTAEGSAVCFKGDNFLKKAGGAAAAGALESKIDPYFKKFGLVGSVLTVNSDGTFTLKAAKMTLSGNITKNDDGTFNFKFKAMGKVSLGSVKTYVQKGVSSLDVMFDATKLMELITKVANISGNSTAKTLGNLLNSYDGLCVGFGMKQTGSVTNSDAASKAAGALKNILK